VRSNFAWFDAMTLTAAGVSATFGLPVRRTLNVLTLTDSGRTALSNVTIITCGVPLGPGMNVTSVMRGPNTCVGEAEGEFARKAPPPLRSATAASTSTAAAGTPPSSPQCHAFIPLPSPMLLPKSLLEPARAASRRILHVNVGYVRLAVQRDCHAHVQRFV
jgi:hypothetical protein